MSAYGTSDYCNAVLQSTQVCIILVICTMEIKLYVLSVPDRVENLAVNSSNASSIMVKWSPPSTPNGVIIAYSVCYWTLGEKCLQPINRSNPVDVEQSIHGLGEYNAVVSIFFKFKCALAYCISTSVSQYLSMHCILHNIYNRN